VDAERPCELQRELATAGHRRVADLDVPLLEIDRLLDGDSAKRACVKPNLWGTAGRASYRTVSRWNLWAS
jgi:hypothetical protein